MFETHYGLTGRPFQLTPDPRFYFESATHRKAMSYLVSVHIPIAGLGLVPVMLGAPPNHPVVPTLIEVVGDCHSRVRMRRAPFDTE